MAHKLSPFPVAGQTPGTQAAQNSTPVLALQSTPLVETPIGGKSELFFM